MKYIATDRNGFTHEVSKLVICIDETATNNIKLAGVYAVIGSNGSDYFILDERNAKQNFRMTRFQDWKETVWLNNAEGATAMQAYKNYKTITAGNFYPALNKRIGKDLPAGNLFVKDNKGIWGVFAKREFMREPLQYTAPALAYRGQLATNGKAEATAAEDRTVVGAPPIAGQSLNFDANSVLLLPQRLDTDVVNVKVMFTTGDSKHYSYKHIGPVNIGDYAVVVVNNDQYPELCGIKVVEVVDVLPMTDACKATKWLVNVFDMKQYKARTEAEARFREAKANLDAKVEEAKRLSVYKMLAKDNPEVANALAGLQELAKVIGTTI